MNDDDVRIAHTKGEHVWHVHDDTDEFFLVLDGRFDVSLRAADGTETTSSARETPSSCRRGPSTSILTPGDRS